MCKKNKKTVFICFLYVKQAAVCGLKCEMPCFIFIFFTAGRFAADDNMCYGFKINGLRLSGYNMRQTMLNLSIFHLYYREVGDILILDRYI